MSSMFSTFSTTWDFRKSTQIPQHLKEFFKNDSNTIQINTGTKIYLYPRSLLSPQLGIINDDLGPPFIVDLQLHLDKDACKAFSYLHTSLISLGAEINLGRITISNLINLIKLVDFVDASFIQKKLDKKLMQTFQCAITGNDHRSQCITSICFSNDVTELKRLHELTKLCGYESAVTIYTKLTEEAKRQLRTLIQPLNFEQVEETTKLVLETSKRI